MATSLRLRAWQHDALVALEQESGRDYLAVATPGAGKTTFALTAVARNLARHPHRRVIVVAPTTHLKSQWAHAAARLGIHLEPAWGSTDRWPGDMHGVVVTYQQVASDPRVLVAPGEDSFVVLDEVHHAGTDRAWGDAVGTAFAGAAHRLSLSGTPFRSDDNPIPFVTYTWDEAVADYSYGYGDALRDRRVVRPVLFPTVDGEMEWSAPDGEVLSATFADELDRTRSSQRLRTALSLDGQWLPEVLARADRTLGEVRRTHADAGGLVVATDVDHAHGIARLLRDRFGRRATVATSDDPTASARIAGFRHSDEEWIVAVRMVSEGVDIPRLRVGVWATTTVTELFFRQAVGRLVRWTPGLRRQRAFLFLPDDVRLRVFAATIAEVRTHALRRRQQDGVIAADEAMFDERGGGAEEQLSLFEALSATATTDQEPSFLADALHDEQEDHGLVPGGLEIHIATPPPPLARHAAGALGDESTVGAVPRSVRKRELRAANADRVQLIVHLTGHEPRVVNATLNQQVPIRSIDAATLDELQRRLALADDWLVRA